MTSTTSWQQQSRQAAEQQQKRPDITNKMVVIGGQNQLQQQYQSSVNDHESPPGFIERLRAPVHGATQQLGSNSSRSTQSTVGFTSTTLQQQEENLALGKMAWMSNPPNDHVWSRPARPGVAARRRRRAERKNAAAGMVVGSLEGSGSGGSGAVPSAVVVLPPRSPVRPAEWWRRPPSPLMWYMRPRWVAEGLGEDGPSVRKVARKGEGGHKQQQPATPRKLAVGDEVRKFGMFCFFLVSSFVRNILWCFSAICVPSCLMGLVRAVGEICLVLHTRSHAPRDGAQGARFNI